MVFKHDHDTCIHCDVYIYWGGGGGGGVIILTNYWHVKNVLDKCMNKVPYKIRI